MADKKPSFQFYYGDWKRDANLSRCSPATRGIWMDILCDMHDLNESGEVSGTLEGHARSCRCSDSEMRTALDELSNTKTADVTERNEIVTIVNRRMKEECLAKTVNKNRQIRHRAKNSGESNGRCNGNITLYSSSSSSSSSSKHKDSCTEPIISILLKTDDEAELSQGYVDELIETFPEVDVMQSLKRIKQWNFDNPTRRKTKRGISNHITSWLSRELDKIKTNDGKQKSFNDLNYQEGVSSDGRF